MLGGVVAERRVEQLVGEQHRGPGRHLAVDGAAQLALARQEAQAAGAVVARRARLVRDDAAPVAAGHHAQAAVGAVGVLQRQPDRHAPLAGAVLLPVRLILMPVADVARLVRPLADQLGRKQRDARMHQVLHQGQDAGIGRQAARARRVGAQPVNLVAPLLVGGDRRIGQPFPVAPLELGVQHRQLRPRQRFRHDQIAVAGERRPLLRAQALPHRPLPYPLTLPSSTPLTKYFWMNG